MIEFVSVGGLAYGPKPKLRKEKESIIKGENYSNSSNIITRLIAANIGSIME